MTIEQDQIIVAKYSMYCQSYPDHLEESPLQDKAYISYTHLHGEPGFEHQQHLLSHTHDVAAAEHKAGIYVIVKRERKACIVSVVVMQYGTENMDDRARYIRAS